MFFFPFVRKEDYTKNFQSHVTWNIVPLKVLDWSGVPIVLFLLEVSLPSVLEFLSPYSYIQVAVLKNNGIILKLTQLFLKCCTSYIF